MAAMRLVKISYLDVIAMWILMKNPSNFEAIDQQLYRIGLETVLPAIECFGWSDGTDLCLSEKNI